MHLLNLTLQSPSAINLAVYGNFSSAKSHEFVVSHGNMLELLRPDENGKVHSVSNVEIFGVARSMVPFRLTGSSKDYLVVGSDSGKITVLEYNNEINRFEVRHSEVYGKTGCRRITPGQYLAADPKGRALLIGAIEKQKLVYVMNRDASNNLTISSPLEGHRSHTIHFDVVGVDVGFENPIFASIEMDYADADADPTGEATSETEKQLVYYELDLGLNQVTRKWSEAVDRTSHKLIPVPGGNDGPGGVLVCCSNAISFYNENHNVLKAYLPRRENYPDPERKSLLISCYAIHKQRDLFFILIQTELGDLYKVSLDYEGETVSQISVQYFDTIHVSNSICITKTGFLFSASEFSNHYLFHFQGIGEGDDTIISTSSLMEVNNESFLFTPRPLKNLMMVDEMESLAPITDMKIMDLAHEQTNQIYLTCGRGTRSSLRVLRHGLAMTEMAVSELPGHPNAVWCVKTNQEDEYDKYIIVSFSNASLVLSIGETVEEVTDSGFLSNTSTLSIQLLADNSFIQIHSNGIRHIKQQIHSSNRINEWKVPGKRQIEKCACNPRQILISLIGGELIYFELDDQNELMEKGRVELGIEIACLNIGNVPMTRQRFPYAAVGGYDNAVRILSLDPKDLMTQKSTLALSTLPNTLCFAEMNSIWYLYVGLHNGVLQQTKCDLLSGNLSDSMTRFLGSKPVQLYRLIIQMQTAVLALSSRSWLSYIHQYRHHLIPLSYETLVSACSFNSEHCMEGIVAIAENTLRILGVEKLGETFNQQKLMLQYTPRKLLIHPISKKILVIESDNQVCKKKDKEEKMKDQNDDEQNDENSQQTIMIDSRIYGNTWASCIRVVDPIDLTTNCLIELDENEAAFSIGACEFHDRGGEVFILVGTVKGLNLHTQEHQGGFVHVYRLINAEQLVLLHSTPVEGIPYSICSFQGRALISIDSILRIYDLGKRKLLRKCENRMMPSFIINLTTSGDRIYACDQHESFHLFKYKRVENALILFADDFCPRFMTCQVLLDYDTIAGGDKFGNVFVCRLPSEISDEVENPTGNRMLWDVGLLNGAPNKLTQLSQFHVGSVITSLAKTSLAPGGMETIVYTTITGGIGALVPFTSREDVDFYSHLEMYLRQENPPLCGRDHLSYRSYFIPVKDVSDGDLCEQFHHLPHEKQKSIAIDLDRNVNEVTKKLQDIRNRLM